jgi:hypothetical protein
LRDCKICGRKSSDEELCEYHQEALINLKSAYEIWSGAKGHLTWEEYIKQVYELEETGRWVKEIIESIMSQSDS